MKSKNPQKKNSIYNFKEFQLLNKKSTKVIGKGVDAAAAWAPMTLGNP